MTGTSSWADAARLRQGLYRFFAGALLPPAPDRIGMLAEGTSLLDDMGVEQYAFAPAWNRVSHLMESPPDYLELDSGYVRLFESGVDGALCPPNETFYSSSARTGGTAMALSELTQLYQEFGLTAGTIQSIPPDHFSTELEVMAALCAEEADLAEISDHHRAGALLVTEQAFLDKHLARWFPAFGERVAAAQPPFFYEAAVVAANAFIQHDFEWVTALASMDSSR